MAEMLDVEPPRIVCTDCVRIVRVHHHERTYYEDALYVVVECCRRVVGRIDALVIKCARMGTRGDLTLRDIEAYNPDQLEELAKRNDQLAASAASRAKWARWAMEAT